MIGIIYGKGVFQHAHVATECVTRSRFKVGLMAILQCHGKIAQAHLALAISGMPQAPENEPSLFSKERYVLPGGKSSLVLGLNVYLKLPWHVPGMLRVIIKYNYTHILVNENPASLNMLESFGLFLKLAIIFKNNGSSVNSSRYFYITYEQLEKLRRGGGNLFIHSASIQTTISGFGRFAVTEDNL